MANVKLRKQSNGNYTADGGKWIIVPAEGGWDVFHFEHVPVQMMCKTLNDVREWLSAEHGLEGWG